jgi:serine phosphatase RsbU (regulator of sigma subunit)
MASTLTPAGLLPVTFSQLEGVDLCACYGAHNRGADFYDVVAAGSRILFLLTDSDAAEANPGEVGQKTQIAFRRNALQFFEPAEVNESDAVAELAHSVNLELIQAAGGARPSPTFLGCFNPETGILTYASGGHLPAYLREGQQFSPLASTGMALGLFTHTTFEAAFLALQPGDALLLTSKGVGQCKRGSDEFGHNRLEECLVASASLSACEICQTVLQRAQNFSNVPWWYVRAALQAKKQAHQDRTVLALIRR